MLPSYTLASMLQKVSYKLHVPLSTCFMNCDENELDIDNIDTLMCLNGDIPLPLV